MDNDEQKEKTINSFDNKMSSSGKHKHREDILLLKLLIVSYLFVHRCPLVSTFLSSFPNQNTQEVKMNAI